MKAKPKIKLKAKTKSGMPRPQWVIDVLEISAPAYQQGVPPTLLRNPRGPQMEVPVVNLLFYLAPGANQQEFDSKFARWLERAWRSWNDA